VNAAASRKRRSLPRAPREAVGVDVDDMLFSSSQQINGLAGARVFARGAAVWLSNSRPGRCCNACAHRRRTHMPYMTARGARAPLAWLHRADWLAAAPRRPRRGCRSGH
jgi:hypothetical protein